MCIYIPLWQWCREVGYTVTVCVPGEGACPRRSPAEVRSVSSSAEEGSRLHSLETRYNIITHEVSYIIYTRDFVFLQKVF